MCLVDACYRNVSDMVYIIEGVPKNSCHTELHTRTAYDQDVSRWLLNKFLNSHRDSNVQKLTAVAMII